MKIMSRCIKTDDRIRCAHCGKYFNSRYECSKHEPYCREFFWNTPQYGLGDIVVLEGDTLGRITGFEGDYEKQCMRYSVEAYDCLYGAWGRSRWHSSYDIRCRLASGVFDKALRTAQELRLSLPERLGGSGCVYIRCRLGGGGKRHLFLEVSAEVDIANTDDCFVNPYDSPV